MEKHFPMQGVMFNVDSKWSNMPVESLISFKERQFRIFPKVLTHIHSEYHSVYALVLLLSTSPL
jgi:hypothetical protein